MERESRQDGERARKQETESYGERERLQDQADLRNESHLIQ